MKKSLIRASLVLALSAIGACGSSNDPLDLTVAAAVPWSRFFGTWHEASSGTVLRLSADAVTMVAGCHSFQASGDWAPTYGNLAEVAGTYVRTASPSQGTSGLSIPARLNISRGSTQRLYAVVRQPSDNADLFTGYDLAPADDATQPAACR